MPTITEAEINADHKRRFAELEAIHGSAWNIPTKENLALGEATRKMWVEFVDERDDTKVDPSRRHDKTQRLESFVEGNPGVEVTAATLADAADCAKGTAYAFIRDNRWSFHAGSKRGTYVIADVAAERAAAGRPVPPTLPAAGANTNTAASTAQDESNIANAALRAVTGHRE